VTWNRKIEEIREENNTKTLKHVFLQRVFTFNSLFLTQYILLWLKTYIH